MSLFCDLVRIPSVYPPGEYVALSERMKKELEAAGVRTEFICAPKEKVEEVGLEHPRPNVVGMIEGAEKSPVLMLGTHLDVVDVDDSDDWQFDPFGGTVDSGRVWGRGTCDAKGAMAAQVFAAKAIRDLGIRLKGSLMLVSSVDDEARFDHLKWPGMTFLAEQGLHAHTCKSDQRQREKPEGRACNGHHAQPSHAISRASRMAPLMIDRVGSTICSPCGRHSAPSGLLFVFEEAFAGFAA